MAYIFAKMLQEQAENIASNWLYEGQYSFYNIAADAEDLAEFLNPQERGEKYFLVTKDNNEIGFFCFEHENNSIDIGLGMKPELTGSGFGFDFLNAGLCFATTKYNPVSITLSVAAFNERAIKLYKKAGFVPSASFMQDTNGSQFEFMRMNYVCRK